MQSQRSINSNFSTSLKLSTNQKNGPLNLKVYFGDNKIRKGMVRLGSFSGGLKVQPFI